MSNNNNPYDKKVNVDVTSAASVETDQTVKKHAKWWSMRLSGPSRLVEYDYIDSEKTERYEDEALIHLINELKKTDPQLVMKVHELTNGKGGKKDNLIQANEIEKMITRHNWIESDPLLDLDVNKDKRASVSELRVAMQNFLKEKGVAVPVEKGREALEYAQFKLLIDSLGQTDPKLLSQVGKLLDKDGNKNGYMEYEEMHRMVMRSPHASSNVLQVLDKNKDQIADANELRVVMQNFLKEKGVPLPVERSHLVSEMALREAVTDLSGFGREHNAADDKLVNQVFELYGKKFPHSENKSLVEISEEIIRDLYHDHITIDPLEIIDSKANGGNGNGKVDMDELRKTMQKFVVEEANHTTNHAPTQVKDVRSDDKSHKR